MAPSEFGTGKSIIVLAVVVGCFAILWPKIFYPMMQTAFSMTSPKPDSSEDVSYSRNERPPHLHPGLANPRIREPEPETTHADKVHIREGRPFPHPSARQPVKPQPKSGGAMSIIMPVYTIGIVVFFLYTVLKLVFKKSPDVDKKPLIKDFHMDPEYRKFVCQEPLEMHSRNLSRERRTSQKKRLERREPQIPEETTEETFDEKDYEIYQLRKRLEETEAAMERIMKHMGAVSECLSSGVLPKDIQASVNASKISNQEGVLKSKKRHLINELQSSAIGTFEIISNSAGTPQEKGNLIKSDKSCANVCICTSNSSIQPRRLQKHTLHCDCTGLVTCEPIRDDESHMSEKIPVEGIQKLERESSINSEASSYEVLSQSQGSSSGGHISASPSGSDGSDNKDADNEASENSADNPSFEALSLERLSPADINRDESFEGVLLSESEDLPKESSQPSKSCVTELTSGVEKLTPKQNENVLEENDM